MDAGAATTCGYDALARLTTVAGQARYTYDPTGNLLSKNDGAPMTLQYTDPEHVHAPKVVNGHEFRYDTNGNMLTRTENGVTYTQTWDAENRLKTVTVNGQTTTFVYDADGQRVKKVQNGQTTVYIGNYYELIRDNSFADNCEGDLSRWRMGGLWHVTTRQASSPTRSLWYGQESTGNYDTGGRTTGALVVRVAGAITGNSVLRFNSWRQVESYNGAFDQTYVQLSTDGGLTWSDALWYKDARDPSEAAWVSSGDISLGVYAGTPNALLRFTFDSVDGLFNNYAGWYIDDVMVSNLGDVSRKYYYAGSQRVAMRENGVLYYLLTDHPGSTSLVTGVGGGEVARQKYFPYGTPRSVSGMLPTDYRFTGQRSEEAGLGSLYDYNARHYSPALGRFISPDTIVPSPGNPQSLNRCAYGLNNPLRYTDPTGHYSNDEIQKYLQDTYGGDWQSYWDAWQADPYWMWVLAEAEDDYLLTTGLGGNVTFRHKDGSFTLDKGKLHDYQGQGVYALYNSAMQLIKDREWLGYRTESGTFGMIFLHAGMNLYYQPIYDYSSGKPIFKEWSKLQVEWSATINPLAGAGVPAFLEFVAKKVPKGGPVVGAVGAITLVDALIVGKADQVSASPAPFSEWPPACNGPTPCAIPNQYQWPNPNGLYPRVPR